MPTDSKCQSRYSARDTPGSRVYSWGASAAVFTGFRTALDSAPMLRQAKAFLLLKPSYVAVRCYAKVFGTPLKIWPLIESRLKGKTGIEVGGPSNIFRKGHLLPLYESVRLDGCNFATETIWEGSLSEGLTFRYGDRVGTQFIAEAWSLPVADERYDFVLSSHMLEHTANPIRALLEWRRILKPNGQLLLLLPDGTRSFDRFRSVTTLDHLISDFERGVEEDDLSHLEESVALHDISLTPDYASRDELRRHLADNRTNRRIHHHVFTEDSAAALVLHCGFNVLATETDVAENIIVFAAK